MQLSKGRFLHNMARVSSPALNTSLPCRPVHSDINSISLGNIQPCHNHCMKTIHTYIFHHCQLVYTTEGIRASLRKWKCLSFEMAAKGIRTQALSIATPAFYPWAIHLVIMKYKLHTFWSKPAPPPSLRGSSLVSVMAFNSVFAPENSRSSKSLIFSNNSLKIDPDRFKEWE